ncbi:dihydrodipicolinate synthase family protein [Telmatospirillum sp. J64-1]|uniref:dihydrodipicolinate synthase family protein n=1 Tax=Telmatospirillum sp. J64-1 TaxID=2502183 RepID=UPI00115D19C6|nr:dihydrodipicolinate synthase family protein [Telmatospirillum sp. J64-1]
MAFSINGDTSGVYIISVTPFSEDGRLDLESTDRLVEFYIDSGVTGFTILGMMGEAQKLTADESRLYANHVLKRVNGRVPVVVGASSPGLDNMKNFVGDVMDAGAAGVMIAPGTGLKTDEQVVNYFRTVFQTLGADVPVVFQDYPQFTGVSISVPALSRLIEEFPQFVMLKHEEFPGLNKLSAIRKLEAKGQRRISILCGNGAIHLCQEMRRGADGAMSGFSYPEVLVQVVDLFRKGETEKAEDLYDIYLPLLRHEYQPGMGLAVRKEILHRRGILASSKVRAPGPVFSAEDHDDLTAMIARMEKKMKGWN